jgi:hypothetical protein
LGWIPGPPRLWPWANHFTSIASSFEWDIKLRFLLPDCLCQGKQKFHLRCCHFVFPASLHIFRLLPSCILVWRQRFILHVLCPDWSISVLESMEEEDREPPPMTKSGRSSQVKGALVFPGDAVDKPKKKVWKRNLRKTVWTVSNCFSRANYDRLYVCHLDAAGALQAIKSALICPKISTFRHQRICDPYNSIQLLPVASFVSAENAVMISHKQVGFINRHISPGEWIGNHSIIGTDFEPFVNCTHNLSPTLCPRTVPLGWRS